MSAPKISLGSSVFNLTIPSASTANNNYNLNTTITSPTIQSNITSPKITSPTIQSNITSPKITSPSVQSKITSPSVQSNINIPNITIPTIKSNITSPNITIPKITSHSVQSNVNTEYNQPSSIYNSLQQFPAPQMSLSIPPQPVVSINQIRIPATKLIPPDIKNLDSANSIQYTNSFASEPIKYSSKHGLINKVTPITQLTIDDNGQSKVVISTLENETKIDLPPDNSTINDISPVAVCRPVQLLNKLQINVELSCKVDNYTADQMAYGLPAERKELSAFEGFNYVMSIPEAKQQVVVQQDLQPATIKTESIFIPDVPQISIPSVTSSVISVPSLSSPLSVPSLSPQILNPKVSAPSPQLPVISQPQSSKPRNFNNIIMGIDLETRQKAEQNVIAKGITPNQAAFNSLVQQEYQKLKLQMIRANTKQIL